METRNRGGRGGTRLRSGGSAGGRRYRGSGRNGKSSFSRRRFSGGGGRSKRGKRKEVLDVNSFINKSVVATETVDHFVPEHAFSDFAIDERIKKTLKDRGYEHPTPIQDKAIPHVLLGEDVVGLANTGTGKTAAFLIPILDKVLKNKKEQVVILAPTRELAIQIEDELKIFAKGQGIYSVVCVGGVPIGGQIRKLKYFNNFIIGTPGRTIDLMKRGILDISKTKTIILDEADRMLDMGFINDIRYVLEKIPTDGRQSLCFSATMAPEIKKLVQDFLIEPVTISVKTQSTPDSIDQDVVRIQGRDKVDILSEYLAQDDFSKVIVFGRTKHGVNKLSTALNKRGLRTESIHGNKSHSQRQRALKQFKSNRVTALIATDVAARGLDISDVSHVINFDLPETYDDYVHRIGRTGRGVNKGKALTFVG